MMYATIRVENNQPKDAEPLTKVQLQHQVIGGEDRISVEFHNDGTIFGEILLDKYEARAIAQTLLAMAEPMDD